MEIVTDTIRFSVEDPGTRAKIMALALGEENVVERKTHRPRLENAGAAWTEEETNKLIDLRFAQKKTHRYIAKQLGRTIAAVSSRVNVLRNKSVVPATTA